MLPEDFYDFKSKLSKGKDTCYPPYLDDVAVIKFEKGFTGMFWNTDMRATEFQYEEFLQKKFIKVWQNFEVFQRKPCPRGIPLHKKDDIVKKLCPLMEGPNRQIFWEALPVADVPALIAEH